MKSQQKQQVQKQHTTEPLFTTRYLSEVINQAKQQLERVGRGGAYAQLLKEFHRATLSVYIEQTGGNVSEVGRLLGLQRRTVDNYCDLANIAINRRKSVAPETPTKKPDHSIKYKHLLKQFHRAILPAFLSEVDYNLSAAALLLGLDRRTVRTYCRAANIPYKKQSTPNDPQKRSTSCLTPAPIKSYSEKAKFSWDCHSHFRRHTRPSAAGFFIPVNYAHRGFMPSSRGLQDGINRNKRVAFLKGNDRTRQPLPTVKNFSGVTEMCNQTTDVVRLPVPVSGESASNISFVPFHPGKVATVNGSMVGAIYPGECRSTRNHETFYDVVFPRITFAADGERQTGKMLDQVTLNSEAEAIAFLTKLVEGEVREGVAA